MVDQANEAVGPQGAIRAIQTRTMVEAMASLPKADFDAIAALVAPGIIARARRSFSLAWFPIEEHMQLCEAVHEVVGSDGFVVLQDAAFASALKTPMLRGILGMIGRVSDDAVALLVRNADRLYGHVTRDLGGFEGQVERPGSATMEITGWPASAGAFEVWLLGTQACTRGSLDMIGGKAASLEVERSDPARGRGTLRIRWSPSV